MPINYDAITGGCAPLVQRLPLQPQSNGYGIQRQLERVLQLLSNRDALYLDEEHIKTILLALLYQSPAYFILSEREMDKKYPDIMLLERSPYQVNYQHLIELKSCKKGDKQAGWDAQKQKGIQQVEEYLQLPSIAALQKLSAWLLLTDTARVEVVRVR